MASTCTQGIDTGFAALGYTKVAALGVLQGNNRAPADLVHRTYASGTGLSGLAGPRIGFSAAMRLAALAVVVSYFWHDVRALTLNSIAAMLRGQFED